MKNLLPLICALMILGSANAQTNLEVEGAREKNYTAAPFSVQGVETVNDTIGPPLISGCNNNAYTFSGSGIGYLTGGNQIGITEIAQAVNLDSTDIEVYSLLVFVTNKEEGANKGSFSGLLYSSRDTIAPDAVLGTTDAVSFDNIDTVNTFTSFEFSSPVSVGAAPFFVALEVENGSDTISVATTGPDCGGGMSLFLDANGWNRYATNFSVTGGGILDPAIYIFAEVENMSVGLDRNLIARKGLDFYPNPAKNQATIAYEMEGENKVSLFVQDVSGRTVFSKEYSVTANNEIELDLSQFQSGTYTYQVVGSKKQLNGVFVKE